MRNALVTGASSGIGEAIYEHLKLTGEFDNVYGLSRRGPDIELDLFTLRGPSRSLYQRVKELDLLINCAGIMPLDERLEQYSIFNVNFWGAYWVIQTLINNLLQGASQHEMAELKWNKCIINIASVSGMKADPDLPIYAASKAALISLTKSLAKSYAPDVRVNCISPGFFKTNLVDEPTPTELIHTIPMKYEEDAKKITPVVDLIWKSQYMTGANIVIDGGVSL
jgi:NAD(P)-dependent dehydrogenase (short-subunit alcohol dehydrogenase family)